MVTPPLAIHRHLWEAGRGCKGREESKREKFIGSKDSSRAPKIPSISQWQMHAKDTGLCHPPATRRLYLICSQKICRELFTNQKEKYKSHNRKKGQRHEPAIHTQKQVKYVWQAHNLLTWECLHTPQLSRTTFVCRGKRTGKERK